MSMDISMDSSSVVTAVVANIIGALLLLAWRKMLAWGVSFNREWSLKWYNTELEQLERIRADSSVLTQILLKHVLVVTFFMGMGMILAPLLLHLSNSGSVVLVCYVVGVVVYLVSAHGIGLVRRVGHDPEKTIESLKKKIEAFNAA